MRPSLEIDVTVCPAEECHLGQPYSGLIVVEGRNLDDVADDIAGVSAAAEIGPGHDVLFPRHYLVQ